MFCVESDQGAFCYVNEVTVKTGGGGGWLPVGTKCVIRELELLVTHLDFQGRERGLILNP